MKVLIILSLLAMAIYTCSAMSADDICEWAATASDEEKAQAEAFFDPIMESVFEDHKAEFMAAAQSDPNLEAYGKTFQISEACESARAGEAAFAQLNADSQALVMQFWSEVGAAIEEAKGGWSK